MTKKREQYAAFGTEFMDLFQLLALCLCALFVLSFCLISVQTEKTVPISERKVEFEISAEWTADNDNDIDLYLIDPLGKVVFFQAREGQCAHLDRDDVGNSSDVIQLPGGGTIKYSENRERISIRAIVPGEYRVGVHAYSMRASPTEAVELRVEKINPFSVVWAGEVVLESNGEWKPCVRFVVGNDGKVTKVQGGHELPFPMPRKARRS